MKDGQPFQFDPKAEAERTDALITSYTNLALGLAKSVLGKGLMLNLATQRSPQSGELEVSVNVERTSALAGLTGEASGEEPELELNVAAVPNSFIVELTFNRPIGLMTMSGDQAVELAQHLINHAKLAGTTKRFDLIV
jgi:hypothetical protein